MMENWWWKLEEIYLGQLHYDLYRLCVGIFDSKWGFFDRWRNIWIKNAIL